MSDFDFQSDGWGDEDDGFEPMAPPDPMQDMGYNDPQGNSMNNMGYNAPQGNTMNNMGYNAPQGNTMNNMGYNAAQGNQEQAVNQAAPREVNLSSKKAGVLLCVVLVILAFIIFAVSQIDFSKKSTPPPVNTKPVESVQPSNTPTQAPSIDLKNTLTPIPNNLELDYTGEVYEAKGVVTSKSRYLNGTQVLHSVDITLTFGSNTEIVSYYTTIATYNSVNIGDSLNVSYQTPQDGYITLTNVTY